MGQGREEKEKVEGQYERGAGNSKGGSITIPLTSCLTGLD
jgi:hypothetical protein